jgi:hypothetical protein
MTAPIPESVSIWLVDWSILAVTCNTTPPRDPNDDEDEDEEGDADSDDEPAVIREPDE